MLKEIAGQPFLYAVNVLAIVAIGSIALYGIIAHIAELYEENQWKRWEKKLWADSSDPEQVSQ